MISPQGFYESLKKEGIEFFSGVPDSLLKEFCLYLESTLTPSQHVISANEGTAVAIAAGSYLGTGSVPLVYLQNSGLGNLINPALSLLDPEVYGIPMVFLIGWRGEPGTKDEPQHIKQGRVTTDMLSSMEIPWRIVGKNESNNGKKLVEWAIQTSKKINGPVALLIKKNVFLDPEINSSKIVNKDELISREDAINAICDSLPENSMIVSTTGMISRELYEIREMSGQGHSRDFLTVGSMGHASQIALGISLSCPNTDITCLDGDGSVLMHMGGMATIGSSSHANLLHIVLNNGAHDSVGGQSTVALEVSLSAIARASGYDRVEGPLKDLKKIKDNIRRLSKVPGKRFIEIQVRKGARESLGRPKEKPNHNKGLFIESLRGSVK